jgi:hypothetical protein
VTPEEKIGEGVRTALESVGIGVSQVEITDYRPAVFGNHVARVETTDGMIRAIFDRQYELDLLDSRIAPERAPEIKRALAAEFSAAIRAGLEST